MPEFIPVMHMHRAFAQQLKLKAAHVPLETRQLMVREMAAELVADLVISAEVGWRQYIMPTASFEDASYVEATQVSEEEREEPSAPCWERRTDG